jgi:hypothetical protein
LKRKRRIKGILGEALGSVLLLSGDVGNPVAARGSLRIELQEVKEALVCSEHLCSPVKEKRDGALIIFEDTWGLRPSKRLRQADRLAAWYLSAGLLMKSEPFLHHTFVLLPKNLKVGLHEEI